jgi:hypothetical protein
VRLRTWDALPQADLSLRSDQFADGSYQQRAHDEHILKLITERFRLRASHMRHVFRYARARVQRVYSSCLVFLAKMARCRPLGLKEWAALHAFEAPLCPVQTA